MPTKSSDAHRCSQSPMEDYGYTLGLQSPTEVHKGPVVYICPWMPLETGRWQWISMKTYVQKPTESSQSSQMFAEHT